MDTTFIEGLVRLLETSSLTEIEHGKPGERIRLVKAARHGISAQPSQKTADVPSADRIPTPAVDTATHGRARQRVEASLAGLFYRAPSADQPAFVQVGDAVEEGQVLCILEAMKMLNPIEAPCAGRVVRIACEEGAAVEPGTLLFELAAEEATDV